MKDDDMIDVLTARCWTITWVNTLPSYMNPEGYGPRPFPENRDGSSKVYTLAEAKARLAELEGPQAGAYPSTKFALDCDTDLVED
jgi:hypothetical protein